jgi:hypothetical protein
LELVWTVEITRQMPLLLLLDIFCDHCVAVMVQCGVLEIRGCDKESFWVDIDFSGDSLVHIVVAHFHCAY